MMHHCYGWNLRLKMLLLQKLFKGDNEELSVVGRLAAGACAGMTSTLVSLACLFAWTQATITEISYIGPILLSGSTKLCWLISTFLEVVYKQWEVMWAETTAARILHICSGLKISRWTLLRRMLDIVPETNCLILSFQVTYPLDVLRLRLAVDPASQSMGQVNI